MADQWRALILSDTHRNLKHAIKAIDTLKPYINGVIHLGDMMGDAEDLRNLYPELGFLYVAGNCDYVINGLEYRFSVAGHKLFLCHGHQYGVKSGYATLIGQARSHGDTIALCGHTHEPYVEQYQGVLALNPGSSGMSVRGSFAVLNLKKDEEPLYAFGNVGEGGFDEAIQVLEK